LPQELRPLNNEKLARLANATGMITAVHLDHQVHPVTLVLTVNQDFQEHLENLAHLARQALTE